MQKTLDIHAPQLSRSDLARVAGIEPQLMKLWVGRGLLKPARKERVSVRSRLHYSIVTVFKAKLMRLISEQVLLGPSRGTEMTGLLDAATLAADSSASSDLVDALADDGWMWAVARRVDNETPFRVYAAVTHSGKCWTLKLCLKVADLETLFEPEISYVVVPVGEIFAAVYRECRELLGPAP